MEEVKNECENKQNNSNQDNDIRDEIIDVLEKLKIGFLGYKIEKTPNVASNQQAAALNVISFNTVGSNKMGKN